MNLITYKHLRLFALFFTFTFTNSCSLMIKLNEEYNPFSKLGILSHPSFCQKENGNKAQTEIIGENPSAVKGTLLFFQKLAAQNISLASIDKFVLWALLQMNFRPHLAAPTSRFQLLINTREQNKFYDFHISDDYFVLNMTSSLLSSHDTKSLLANSKKSSQPKTNHLRQRDVNFVPNPFLYGLETLLHDYHSKHTLAGLAKLLDEQFTSEIKVDSILNKFLKTNTPLLSSQKSLHPNIIKKLFRDDELITIDENLPHLNYSKIISSYSLAHKNKALDFIYSKTAPLFDESFVFNQKQLPVQAQTQNSEAHIKTTCNTDLQSYRKSQTTINDRIIQGNTYGLKIVDTSYMAHNIQSLPETKWEFLYQSFLLKGQSRTSGAIFCSIEIPLADKLYLINLLSTNERDPAQHIYHLLTENFFHLKDPENLSQIINGPRYLVLENPTRLLIESRKTNQDQMQKIINYGIPLYHIESLGKVWSFVKALSPGSKPNYGLFIADNRFDERPLCK
jgi:hypothetical protein